MYKQNTLHSCRNISLSRFITILLVWALLYVPSAQAAPPSAQQSRAYEALQRKYEAALQEIERLRSALEALQRERATAPAPQAGAVEHGPGDDPLHAGNTHFMAQRYTEAVAAYSRALEAIPRDARAYKNRGLAHAKLGNSQQAHTDLSKAIEFDPQDAIAYNQRGILSFAAGNAAVALQDFTQAITLQPQLAEAYNNRGIIQRQRGDYRQAGQDFERAVQLGMTLATQHRQVLRDEARQAQERLRSAGFNAGTADGVPGQQTVTALRQYQKAHALPVTGLLDEATRKALGIASEAPGGRQTGETPRFVHQPAPVYPEIARQQGWEGTVTLRLELLPDGSVGAVQVGRSSGHTVLDTAAQEAAKAWRHEPVPQDGTPVTRWAEMHLNFKLDRGQGTESAKPQ